MIRAKHVFNAFIPVENEPHDCVIFKENPIAVRWCLIFLIFEIIVVEVSLVSWIEFYLWLVVTRVFWTLVNVRYNAVSEILSLLATSFRDGQLIKLVYKHRGHLKLVSGHHFIEGNIKSVIQISHNEIVIGKGVWI